MLIRNRLSVLLSATILCSFFLSACSNQTQDSTNQQQLETRLIPLTAFFNDALITEISLSPDGQWIAFFKEWNGARNIFLVRKDQPLTQAIAITRSQEPISSFQWSTSGNSIFFIQDEGGTENTQIYHLSFSNKPQLDPQIKPLTHNPKVKYQLLGQSKDIPTRLVLMSNQDNPKQMDIYHLNTHSGEIVKVADNSLGFSQVELDSGGNPAISIGSNTDNTDTLYIYAKNDWLPVFTTEFGENIDLLNFDETNQHAFVTGNIQTRDKQELLRFDLTTHIFTPIHKDPNNQSDVFDVEFNDNGQPIAVSYYGGHLRTYPLDEDFAYHWHNINQYFNGDVEITIKSINEQTKIWQLSIASDVSMNKDYRYDANTEKFQSLLSQPAAIDPNLLSKRQSISYQARDGVNIQAYLTLPTTHNANLPTIILPHGGPWARDYWTLGSGYFNPIAQLLANRGYAVLQPNFRASTGFGKHFLNLGNKNWGLGGMQHDLTDGVNYLVEKGIADKNRIGIMGASYGGYAALAGITFTPDLYKAAVSYVGPSSLITLLEAFPPHFRPYLGQFFSAVGDPLINTDRADMIKRSPINYVKNIKTPLLLVQGANDPRVTQIESDNIAKVMYAKGLPVEYILAKDEGHGFSKRNNKLAYIVAMEQFFSKHLGGLTDTKVNEEIKQHLQSLEVDVSQL